MPNIFNHNVHDYAHLDAIKAAGFLDSHNSNLRSRGMEHNFNALRDAHNPMPMPLNAADSTAQAVGFLTNNLQAVQAEIEEVLYTDFRLDEFVPIITDIPEGVTTYSYRVTDKAGKGSFITNNGSDAPNAQVGMRNQAYSLEYGGIVPEWTLEDLRRAAFTGVALDNETIKAATEGAMDHIEQVGLLGDDSVGFKGLVNHDEIVKTTASKTIAASSAQEVVEMLNDMIGGIVEQSAEVVGRVIRKDMMIYLPVAQYNRVTTLAYGDNAEKTVWGYVKKNNPWTSRTGQEVTLASVAELKGAGAGDTDRMLIGFKDKRIMEMAMPIAPRVITTINEGYVVKAPIEYKISGLNVKRPTAMRHVDGV